MFVLVLGPPGPQVCFLSRGENFEVFVFAIKSVPVAELSFNADFSCSQPVRQTHKCHHNRLHLRVTEPKIEGCSFSFSEVN